MTKYRLKMMETHEFEGEKPSDVVDFLKNYIELLHGSTDERALPRMAHSMISYTNSNIRFDNRENFAKSIMEMGLLEEVK
jgi:hemerythrin-like domain-containing protein